MQNESMKRFVGVGALLLVLIGTPIASAQIVKTTAIIAVVKEWKIATNTPSHVAGPITFYIDSQGNIDHEFVIIQTDAPGRDLVAQVDPVTMRLDEEMLTSPGEYGDLPTGVTGTFTIDLPAGHYVLMCNIAAHYQQGMFVDLEVMGN
jgi:uncharacterized cupredoxin-like copper-binding protein